MDTCVGVIKLWLACSRAWSRPSEWLSRFETRKKQKEKEKKRTLLGGITTLAYDSGVAVALFAAITQPGDEEEEDVAQASLPVGRNVQFVDCWDVGAPVPCPHLLDLSYPPVLIRCLLAA